jgi:hypothetical protein
VACILATLTIFVLIGSALTEEAGLSTAKANVDKRKTVPTTYNQAFFIMNHLQNISGTHKSNLHANKEIQINNFYVINIIDKYFLLKLLAIFSTNS